MFRTLLIANRGEIACRIVRTARLLGLRTVAVFSEADCDARHVRLADEAYPIGPAPARESYLHIGRILDAALASGAEALHPGYGFLSENADFAEACAAAGLVFVGPPPAAIRAMGSKAAAKALMAEAGVPLVPGYHDADQEAGRLAREAERIGYPVLIKASAGGGGKGMRIAERPAAFAEALALAKGEARASFGDDRVLIERYLLRPRHVEVQVFADRQGHVVHLFERDCSIQRRHQKVVEEAPAPGLSPARRGAMGEAACAAARAIGYEGAGTVEFILDGDAFYFMEMNTRLQVEHPVTEMITGLDLVAWQLRVAAGEPLPLGQTDLAIDGHAVEARLYAEDPAQDYRPSTGRLGLLRFPGEGRHVRVETGVVAGDMIPVHYDPMIAKLVAWDRDRPAALRRLAAALAETAVAGVATNLALLRRICADPEFAAGPVDTGFLDRRPALLAPGAEAPPLAALAGAAAAAFESWATAPRDPRDPHSPWDLPTAWRLDGDGYQDLALRQGETEIMLRLFPRAEGGFALEAEGRRVAVRRGEGDVLWIDGARRVVPVACDGGVIQVVVDGVAWRFTHLDPLAPVAGASLGTDRLVATMPGRIVEVMAAPGDVVARGAVLLVLEAMKVQMRLAAPRDGVVAAVRARAGDLVEEGAELVTFETASPDAPA